MSFAGVKNKAASVFGAKNRAVSVQARPKEPAVSVQARQQMPAAYVQAQHQMPAAYVQAQQQMPAAYVQAQQQMPAASVQAQQQMPAAYVQAQHQMPAAYVQAQQQMPAAYVQAQQDLPDFPFFIPPAPPIRRNWACQVKPCDLFFRNEHDRVAHQKANHPRCPVYGCIAGPFDDHHGLRRHREVSHSSIPVQYTLDKYYNHRVQFVRGGWLHTGRGHPYGENLQENDHLYFAPDGETEEEKKVRRAKIHALAEKVERKARWVERKGHSRNKSY